MDNTKVGAITAADKQEAMLRAVVVMAEYVLATAPGGNSVHRHLNDVIDALRGKTPEVEAAPAVEKPEVVEPKLVPQSQSETAKPVVETQPTSAKLPYGLKEPAMPVVVSTTTFDAKTDAGKPDTK